MEMDREEEIIMLPSIDNQPSVQCPGLPCESSSSCSQTLFIPHVKNDLIPKLNQEFECLDDVQQFYNNYAKEAGFGTRSSSSRKNRQYEIVRKEYCCSKQGVGVQVTSQETTRVRGISKEGCGAKLAVVKKAEKYVVTQFVEGHSHSFASPRRVHLLRSHRNVSSAKRALIQELSAANVPPCQQMSVFELQSGGLEHVGFLQQDLYNVERDRKKLLAGHDLNMLYEHFMIEQEKNSGFTFTVETDDDGRMTRCFWVDAIARKSYQFFGDVVVFDTTYNTNRYSLIFAPILGVNHHRQTTLFGCAFLSDETTDSFEWLFRVWLKAMPAGPPKMIITDQDPAMTKAIAIVMPNTHHRFCIWHIVNKFSEKLGAMSYRDHFDEFKSCIWNSETPEQFEYGWQQVVVKANLVGNDWLQNIYTIRERWVPAYMKHIFSAHMTSSQRAEITHSFFKKYVSPQNSLLDFVTRFERALARLRHNEMDKDHKDLNEKPRLKTLYPMESSISELYTHEMFYKFQEQLFQSMAYKVMMRNEDEYCFLYTIERIKGSGLRVREIMVEKSSNHVSCSCKMMESDGIPCRHMLAYFIRLQMEDLPNKYILPRWMNSAKAMRVRDDQGSGMNEGYNSSSLERRFKLFKLASNVIDDAIVNEEATQLVEDVLRSTQKKVHAIRGVGDGGEGSAMKVPQVHDHGIKEPLLVRAKRCGRRMKGGKEKMIKKARRCHGCGLTGQSHDKRNCPSLGLASSQSAWLNDEDEEEDEDEVDYDE